MHNITYGMTGYFLFSFSFLLVVTLVHYCPLFQNQLWRDSTTTLPRVLFPMLLQPHASRCTVSHAPTRGSGVSGRTCTKQRHLRESYVSAFLLHVSLSLPLVDFTLTPRLSTTLLHLRLLNKIITEKIKCCNDLMNKK